MQAAQGLVIRNCALVQAAIGCCILLLAPSLAVLTLGTLGSKDLICICSGQYLQLVLVVFIFSN